MIALRAKISSELDDWRIVCAADFKTQKRSVKSQSSNLRRLMKTRQRLILLPGAFKAARTSKIARLNEALK
jgi:hypothetical protein